MARAAFTAAPFRLLATPAPSSRVPLRMSSAPAPPAPPSPPAPPAPPAPPEERFDVLTPSGAPTGASAPRSRVHRDGLWHRSTHVWVASRAARAVLLQRRAPAKDTFPGRWDVSAAGHVSAGGGSAEAAARELQEELGLAGPLEFLFTARAEAAGAARGVRFVDRELQDVYVFAGGAVGVRDVVVQPEEVDEVRYWPVDEYRAALAAGDERFVPRSPHYIDQLFPWFDEYMPRDPAA